MKRLLIAAVAASALTLAACETATPYQPIAAAGHNHASGGFSEQRVEPNRWRVTFAGNSLTSRETVETYLLYRSAELSLAQGYDWFSLVDRHTDRDTRLYTDPVGPGFYGPGYGFGGYWGPSWRYYRRGAWGGWGGWGGGWGPGAFDVQQVTKFEATAEIVMGHGAKPAGDRRAFEARAVVDNLNGKIVRPTA